MSQLALMHRSSLLEQNLTEWFPPFPYDVEVIGTAEVSRRKNKGKATPISILAAILKKNGGGYDKNEPRQLTFSPKHSEVEINSDVDPTKRLTKIEKNYDD